MFTAGHETTANALTFAWYLLAQHPREQDALHEELHDVLGGRSPTAADLDKLPYTRAVVSETMRLFPPAWSVARQAKDQITIGGCTLPADSVVLMSQWVVHHDERWWPSPETFDPQRWMTESKLDPQRGSISKTDRPRYAYFPFGGGSRSCIGEAFAWTEAILLIATLAQRWKPELIATPNVKLQPTITLRPRYGIAMRLVPR
jgi:cytochrome P450